MITSILSKIALTTSTSISDNSFFYSSYSQEITHTINAPLLLIEVGVNI